MMKLSELKHPDQPVGLDAEGTVRFKPNAIVNWMLECGRDGRRFDLNTIGEMGSGRRSIHFSEEDISQFWQLMGYSVSGYGDISIVSRASVARADNEVERLMEGCPGEPKTTDDERDELRVLLAEAQGELRHLRSVLEELADVCKTALEG